MTRAVIIHAVLAYVTLVIATALVLWLSWRANLIEGVGRLASLGVLFWGAGGILFFAGHLASGGAQPAPNVFVWMAIFMGYVAFIFLIDKFPRGRFPKWLYVLVLVPIIVFILASNLSNQNTVLLVMLFLQLLLLYFALPTWYAVAIGLAPEGRVIWIPSLLFFGMGITTWIAISPGYNLPAMTLALVVLLLGLWLIVVGLEKETRGKPVTLGILTNVAIAFQTMWLLLLYQWCYPAGHLSGIPMKIWFASIGSLLGALSIFLPLFLFKSRSENKLARWTDILSSLTIFPWDQSSPTPESVAEDLLQILRRYCENIVGLRIFLFGDLIVGQRTKYGLTLKDRDYPVGRVYLGNERRCGLFLKLLMPMVAHRLSEVSKSLKWQVEAHTDPLTGLLNRRGMEVKLPLLIEKAISQGLPLAVAMVDIDHFKTFNDRYGHPVGDILLRSLAGVLSNNLREDDLAVRWGGEEFLLLLLGNDADSAKRVLNRIREKVSGLQLTEIHDYLTVSIGLAGGKIPHSNDVVWKWIDLSDQALLRAKASGRNRIVVAGNEDGS